MNEFQKIIAWILFGFLLFIWSAAEIFYYVRSFFEKE